MRIAQIAPAWIAVPPKNYGGTEAVIYNLVEAQVAQGHEVTLYTPGSSKTSAQQISFFPEALMDEGTPWTAYLKSYYHLIKSVNDIKEKSYDIIHTHLSSTSDLLLLPLIAQLSTPHIVTLHSNFPFDHVPDGWTGDADRYFMDWAPDMPMVAISQRAREQALAAFPLNFAGVVYNGISMQQYQPTGRKREDFFMWLGRYTPEKGPHRAIRAAMKAGVPIVLAGPVEHATTELAVHFEEEVRPLVDGKNVRLIGPVNMEQKVSYLSRARGFLNPIEWEEPFGVVMIEAMALGCPVISFERGAASEVVAHGESGYLVRDIDEMVEYIGRIDELDREVVREHVATHFSSQTMARNYNEIYEQVIVSEAQKTPPVLLSDILESFS